MGSLPTFKTKHNFFKNSFFPSTIIEWNKLDTNLRNSSSYSNFKKGILQFIRPAPNNVFDCHNPQGIKYVTRLRLGLSHLREHKFKHNFQDCLNPLCSCGIDVESTSHFLLHCPFFNKERSTLLRNLKDINEKLLDKSDSTLTNILLFGDASMDNNTNKAILNTVIDFILASKRFEDSLV